jgi:hypothetical protein
MTHYKRNIIQDAVIHNELIEEKLNIITVISNPCLYKRRYVLMKEFIKRIESFEKNVNLYIVELAYADQEFRITTSYNKKHLQLRTNIPLWHKENMINLGVKNLLPVNWKAFAWIDCDLEFENLNWVNDTLKILNGTCDIIQLFSHCVDMGKTGETLGIHTGFGYQFIHDRPYSSNDKLNKWHPGYAWACTRTAYEQIGGLFDCAIIGGGDHIMALSLINKALMNNKDSSNDYKEIILNYQDKFTDLRLGYVPGVIKHYFHGSKANRKYTQRKEILLKYNYEPSIFITKNKESIVVPSNECPQELVEEIFNYFLERNEDE